MKNILYVLVGLMAGFVLAAILLIVTRLPAGQPVTLEPPPTEVPIVIQVIGAVVKPGVYSMPEGSRVQDAVNAAGGLEADADSNAVNLAARLEDGQQVIIPVMGGAAGGILAVSTPTRSPFVVITTFTPTTTPSSPGGLVNINTATAQQLEVLPCLGTVYAQSIITYRQQHGPFQHIEDIMNVSGIGFTTFDCISSRITVGP
ncbi:MAG TPA: ComEA family DNA-binding protein [Anaerolineales bacterium]|nr:ComEA family DNA-binding protein [Anaerolineales bacterium]